jgi:hypothetical protein
MSLSAMLSARVQALAAQVDALDARVQALAAAVTPRHQRALRDGLLLAGLIFNATVVLFWSARLDLWVDARAWWAINLDNLYGPGEQSLGLIGAFRYSPAAAWLLFPATLLSWNALIATYLVINIAALWAMLGRWTPVILLAFPPVLLELINGNIAILLALAIWAGLRWPWAWAFVLLTKVTPGVGLLWFAVRREWRNLAMALGATLAIVIIGFAIAPALWLEWFRSLAIASAVPAPAGVPPLLVRLPIAAAIVVYAARSGRAWLVPVAAFLAQPILWLHGTAILTASIPLWWERNRWRRPSPAPAGSATATATKPVEAPAADRTEQRVAEGSAS